MIWKTFKTGPDDMCTFSGLIRTCSAADFGPPPIVDKRPVGEKEGFLMSLFFSSNFSPKYWWEREARASRQDYNLIRGHWCDASVFDRF